MHDQSRRDFLAGAVGFGVGAVGIGLIAAKALHADADWTVVKAQAAYSVRDSTRTFFHDGYWYLSNGYQHGNLLIPDLWKSEDAINWHIVNALTPYTGWCPITSFNGDIVAVGAKVWRSTNGGVSFSVALETPPFAVADNTVETWWLIVRGNRLFMFGASKIWHTTDLVNWSSIDLPFFRNNFAIWDYRGSIFLAAGNTDVANSPAEVGYPGRTSYNDVWRCDDPLDGDSWTQVTSSAPWATRMWPAFCVHGDEMVISGGYNNVTGATNYSDTWVSRDGVTWRQIGGEEYSARHYAAMFSHRGRLLLQNGNRSPNDNPGVSNDVWELAPS